MFTSDPALMDLVSHVMLILPAYIIADGLEVVLSGVLKGAGLQALAAPVVVISYYAVGVPASYLLGFQAKLQVRLICSCSSG